MTDCITLPKAMNELLEIANIFALDLFSESKMPCAFVGFTYFHKVVVAIVVPLVLPVVFFAGGIVWASKRKRKRRASNVPLPKLIIFRERRRGTHNSIIKAGLWKVAAPLLFVLDLLYPPVNILQSTFLDWTPCFSQLRPRFSFLLLP